MTRIQSEILVALV